MMIVIYTMMMLIMYNVTLNQNGEPVQLFCGQSNRALLSPVFRRHTWLRPKE